jgi:hypothetical protein
MTTVFTRLYANEKKARSVQDRLRFLGFPPNALQVIPQGGDDLVHRMVRAKVPADAAAIYADKLVEGRALLVVRATYKPLGAPTIARDILSRSDALDSGVHPEEAYFADGPDHAPSVLQSHPRFLTLPLEAEDFPPGPITSRVGMPLTSTRRTSRSAMSGTRYMSRMFWPMPLLTKKRTSRSAMGGTRHMSRLFWPMPLLSSKPRSNRVIRGGALPLSRALGWSTLWR